MLNDFYIRRSDDPNYVDGILSVSNEIEEVVTQTKMVLLTNKGEVMGDPDFGMSSIKHLFEFEHDVNPDLIEGEASEQIRAYVTYSEKYDIGTTAVAFPINEHQSGIGLEINIGNIGKFGVLFEE